MTYYSSVTSKGQLTLPAEIRKKLNIKPGQRVEVRLGPGGNAEVVKPVDIEDLRKRTAAHLKKHNIKPLTDEELDEAIDKSFTETAIKRYKRSLE